MIYLANKVKRINVLEISIDYLDNKNKNVVF